MWKLADGYGAMLTIKVLWFPFLACLFFLFINMLFLVKFPAVWNVELEEGLFNFLDSRARLAISATASILIVSTIIYGVSAHKFIRFEVLSFISLIGLMAPICRQTGPNGS